jgi:hypothetical protein
MDCRVEPGNDEGGHLRESRGEIAGNRVRCVLFEM